MPPIPWLTRALVAFLGLLWLATASTAQVVPPPPSDAADASATSGAPEVFSGTIVRLTEVAEFQEGCFPPCLCPVFYTEDLGGTMRITPMSSPTAAVQRWRVTDVNWFVSWGTGSRRVTGAGVYSRTILPGAPPSHRLELELAIDDEPADRYDSGPQPLLSPFPTVRPVFDLVVSRAGMVCYDRVFRVAVAIPPQSSIRQLDVAGTRYLEGCFPPCLCPIMFVEEVRGTLDLVPLGRAGGMDNYAVVNARWSSASPTPALPLTAYGFGILRVGSPTILPVIQQVMVMDLHVSGTPGRFWSELHPAPVLPPAIDIGISENGRYCYDRAFDLIASPGP